MEKTSYPNVSFPCRSERLDSEKLPLFHLRHVASLHYGHTLARVDLVRTDRVARQVPNGLDLVRLAINLHLVPTRKCQSFVVEISSHFALTYLVEWALG